MYDSTSVLGRELLSYFGKNTTVRIDHKFGSTECRVLSARTNNVIAHVSVTSTGFTVREDGKESTVRCERLESAAEAVQGLRRFPRGRKMNRAWSVIRLTAAAEADRDVNRATMAWYTS